MSTPNGSIGPSSDPFEVVGAESSELTPRPDDLDEAIGQLRAARVGPGDAQRSPGGREAGDDTVSPAEAMDRILDFCRRHPDALHRTCLDGHLTGSAIVVDPAGTRTLLLHHAKLDGCFVGDDMVLGELGGGFKLALTALDSGRIGIGAQAVGIHRACLEHSVKYAQEREQFGKPISHHQAIAFKLADMATELDAARLLVQRAAWLRDQGETATKECSMAKLYASRACNKAAQDAVQIHGGAGYTKEFPVERFYRDARITEIYEGATDVQRIVISRRLFQG